MARASRQSKILEIISTQEIETQDELAKELENLNFKITQATISRDIKELGLTKILCSNGKYKYSPVSLEDQVMSVKHIDILKNCIVSIKDTMNFVVIKTIKGMAASVCAYMDKLNLVGLMGATYGDDTVMLIFPTFALAIDGAQQMNKILYL